MSINQLVFEVLNTCFNALHREQIENLYIVDIGDLQPLYVSKDGEFFFYGELYAINGFKMNYFEGITYNLTTL